MQAPDQSSATYAPGGYDVTVTSTIWTTYWTWVYGILINLDSR